MIVKKSVLLIGAVAFFEGISTQELRVCQGTTELLFGSTQGSSTESFNACIGLEGEYKTFINQDDFAQFAQLVPAERTFYVGIVSNGAEEVSTSKFVSVDGRNAGIEFAVEAGIGNFPWDINQPDSAVENCVIISGDSGLLFDVDCEEPHGFVCKFPISPACPDKNFGFCDDGKEHIFSVAPGSFNDGESLCGSLGGNIKTFDNANDFSSILGFFPTGNRDTFYVGIVSNGAEALSTSKFVSIDGNNAGIGFATEVGIGSPPWDNAQPDSATDGCVVLSGQSGLLSDVNCDELHGVVCEIPNSPSCAQPKELCLSDQTVIVDTGGGNFFGGDLGCLFGFEGSFFSVGSNVERQAILELNSQLGTSDVWIGLRFNGRNQDFQNTSNFEFVDGTTDDVDFFQVPNGEFPWAPGEPSGLFDCVKMDGSTGLFVTAECLEEHPYICSIPAPCNDGRVIPDNWNCFPSFFNASNDCHCSCGVQDPDCDATGFQAILNCDANVDECVDGECVTFPPTPPSAAPSSSPTSTAPAPECRAKALGIKRPLPEPAEEVPQII